MYNSFSFYQPKSLKEKKKKKGKIARKKPAVILRILEELALVLIPHQLDLGVSIWKESAQMGLKEGKLNSVVCIILGSTETKECNHLCLSFALIFQRSAAFC